MSIELIHADEFVLIVDKPAGLPVLPDGWSADAPFLKKMLEAEYGPIWIVHRLDKITSGVMVFARTAEAHRNLNTQFETHRIEKVYHAIVHGSPDWSEHTSAQPLKADTGHRHRTVVHYRLGKPAVTRFRLLERFAALALLEAIPETGRTHQIRAHAAVANHPLLGDTLYGAPATDVISRPALHAWSLSFVHPDSGISLSFTAPYPEDLSQALVRLRGAG